MSGVRPNFYEYWVGPGQDESLKEIVKFFHIAEVPHSTWGNPALDFWGSSTNCQKNTTFLQLYILYMIFALQKHINSDDTPTTTIRDVSGTSPTWTSYLQRPGSLPSGPGAPDHQACAQNLFNITTFPVLGKFMIILLMEIILHQLIW